MKTFSVTTVYTNLALFTDSPKKIFNPLLVNTVHYIESIIQEIGIVSFRNGSHVMTFRIPKQRCPYYGDMDSSGEEEWRYVRSSSWVSSISNFAIGWFVILFNRRHNIVTVLMLTSANCFARVMISLRLLERNVYASHLWKSQMRQTSFARRHYYQQVNLLSHWMEIGWSIMIHLMRHFHVHILSIKLLSNSMFKSWTYIKHMRMFWGLKY